MEDDSYHVKFIEYSILTFVKVDSFQGYDNKSIELLVVLTYGGYFTYSHSHSRQGEAQAH